jgi:hypothetical protein
MSTKGEWLSTTLGRESTGQVAVAAMTKGTITNAGGTDKGSTATVWAAGVVSHDVEIGDPVYVFPLGSVVLVQAASAITAGNRVVADGTATGKARPATTGEMAIGIALDTVTTLDDWLLIRLQNTIAL